MDEDEKDGGFAIRASHQQIAVIVAFFLGLFVLALGAGLYFFKSSSNSEDIKILSGASPGSSAEIVVDVGGAVANPGIYKLHGEVRVADAVTAAGGLTGDADGKQVNLAAKVSDGQKVYVPNTGQNSNVKSQNDGSVAGATNLVSINNGTAAELDTLPGIGPVTAQKIISLRPYSSIDELLSKKAVSASVFEKIKDKISL